MSGFLEQMAASSLERARRARRAMPEGQLRSRMDAAPSPPALELDGFDVIAEVKHRSPSRGVLGDDRDLERRVRAYCAGGAVAVSVLTEPDEFGGDLEHLRVASRVAGEAGRPVMRKDFLVDPYQVVEARASGAGGVLLIVKILSDAQLSELMAGASELGMFCLVEVFGVEDLHRIGDLLAGSAAGSVLVGVNCRDLRTLEVDPTRFRVLRDLIGSGLPAVAESGIESPDDAAAVASDGYRLALIGSALMRSVEPDAAVAAFVSAGRRTIGRSPCS